MPANDSTDVGTYTIGYIVYLQNYSYVVSNVENANAFSYTVTPACSGATITVPEQNAFKYHYERPLTFTLIPFVTIPSGCAITYTVQWDINGGDFSSYLDQETLIWNNPNMSESKVIFPPGDYTLTVTG